MHPPSTGEYQKLDESVLMDPDRAFANTRRVPDPLIRDLWSAVVWPSLASCLETSAHSVIRGRTVSAVVASGAAWGFTMREAASESWREGLPSPRVTDEACQGVGHWGAGACRLVRGSIGNARTTHSRTSCGRIGRYRSVMFWVHLLDGDGTTCLQMVAKISQQPLLLFLSAFCRAVSIRRISGMTSASHSATRS